MNDARRYTASMEGLTMAKTTEYRVGDAVSYRGAFLRSVGWYTNVPRRGIVTRVTAYPHGWTLLDVAWDDDAPSRVNASNVMPAGRPDVS